MRYWEIVMESPRMVSDTDFGLGNYQVNHALAKELLLDIQEVIRENDDYILSRSGDISSGYITMIDKSDKTIHYLVEYKSEILPNFGKTVTQVSLWRDPSYEYVENLTKEMFFDCLLKKFSAIISDDHQTNAGKEFWVARMRQANKLGFKVYFVNEKTNEYELFDNKKEKFTTWIKKHNDKWSTDYSARFYRFVISN